MSLRPLSVTSIILTRLCCNYATYASQQNQPDQLLYWTIPHAVTLCVNQFYRLSFNTGNKTRKHGWLSAINHVLAYIGMNN
jgi:hypothetical protein